MEITVQEINETRRNLDAIMRARKGIEESRIVLSEDNAWKKMSRHESIITIQFLVEAICTKAKAEIAIGMTY